ncbi:hypothetical protein ACJJTC_007909 [Scirpophaga incertulas]
MSRAKKMIEAACSRSHQNDEIFFTKKSIESMPVILAAGPLTSDAYSDVNMQIDDEPIDEGLSLYSGPITSVTKECMASSGPAATSQASPRHDNSSTLIDTYISDDSDYNNKQLVPYSEHSDSNNEEEPRQIKRKKRCQVNKSTWNEYKNKLNREKGREYNGRKKVNGKWERTFKNKRVLKPRCKCKTNDKTALKCCEIKEEDRNVLYEKFWGMTWGEKKVFVNSLVQEMPTKRPRDRKDPSITKRKSSMIYNLHSNDDRRVRVCKTMFQNTLCITKMTIWNWKKGKENTSNNNQNVSARKNPHEAEVESLIGFLNSIPKMESHYCRKTTAKLYLLPEWTSKRALYEFYIKDWCATRNIKPLSIAKFSNTLEIENISLFKPKKDECEKCLSHKIGNIPDTEHKEHIERKNEARIEKENDKNSEEHVFTMDTQAVLLAPKSNVSSLYYKTKLCTHNFCIFNLRNKDGFCYLWNETEGGLSSDNYATIIVKFITDKLLPSIRRVPDNDVKIVLYSDGCTGQNRNVILANALLNVATFNNITIEQKYLEVGHTQMEADSMHATIERKLKNKVIHVPAEYVGVCLGARIHPKPYIVSYLTHDFFKSFGSLQYYKSIRPGKATGDAKVTDIRALQYKNGNIQFKLRFKDEWQLLPQRCDRKTTPIAIENLPDLHATRLKIKNRKFKDLQELKSTLPVDYRDFYDNIPHE